MIVEATIIGQANQVTWRRQSLRKAPSQGTEEATLLSNPRNDQQINKLLKPCKMLNTYITALLQVRALSMQQTKNH